ncbi:response regulator [Flavobacterium jejuense]|uniref:histidine kinase n=1 Tax=Flavobacterium jejuense TaxID=1544455 RepID=A0ABX0IMR5_9FLAO|nr:ATP-binding protein [Flavobacterium jejuense]NHN24526.1 response regulator [Flavobacterium jejuense]
MANELRITNDVEATQAIQLANESLGNLELTKCLDYSETLLNYSLKNKKDYFTANAYNFIGLCYEELKDLKKAEAYYLKAISYAKLSKDNRLINLVYSTLANLYLYHEIDNQKAIENFEKAYEYALISKDSMDIIYTEIGLVQSYFEIGKLELGFKHLMDFESYIKPLDKLRFNILFYAYKGFYFRKKDNFEEAEANYLKVISYLENIDKEYDKTYAVDAYYEIYDFYKEYKKYDLALKYLEKHDVIEDELEEKGKQRQIKLLGAPIEAKVSNLKIQKIETEKKLQETQLQKATLINKIILIVVIFMLVIILIISSYTYVTKKINNNLKISNDALQASMVKAEEANIAKSKFIATITHELRTPLYGVIGITNILGNDYKELKESPHLKSLEFSAKYLLQLVNDVLIMSKIEDTEIQLNKEVFDLEKELEIMVDSLQLIAKDTKNKLILKPFYPLPKWIETDRIRISQIIINLISNSLKFTKKGVVYLEVRQIKENDHFFIEFKVIDNGIGISKELHNKVFDKFVQIERKEDDYQGTGLGLTIVKKLVTLLGGSIKLESEENKGTTITFVIPYQPVSDDLLERTAIDFSSSVELNCNVLIVEDNKINQLVTRKILELKNIKCTILDDGYQAIELLKKQSFDIILMDINMPMINGLETTKILRSNGVEVPIIAVTAFEKDQIAEDIYKIGFNDILVKPFNSNDLYQIIFQYTK